MSKSTSPSSKDRLKQHNSSWIGFRGSKEKWNGTRRTFTGIALVILSLLFLEERLCANNDLDDWDPLAAGLYRNYLAVVILYKEACNGFLKQIEETSEYFTNLEGHYEFVEEKTRALQFACEKLLQEQVTGHMCICFYP